MDLEKLVNGLATPDLEREQERLASVLRNAKLQLELLQKILELKRLLEE